MRVRDESNVGESNVGLIDKQQSGAVEIAHLKQEIRQNSEECGGFKNERAAAAVLRVTGGAEEHDNAACGATKHAGLLCGMRLMRCNDLTASDPAQLQPVLWSEPRSSRRWSMEGLCVAALRAAGLCHPTTKVSATSRSSA